MTRSDYVMFLVAGIIIWLTVLLWPVHKTTRIVTLHNLNTCQQELIQLKMNACYHLTTTGKAPVEFWGLVAQYDTGACRAITGKVFDGIDDLDCDHPHR